MQQAVSIYQMDLVKDLFKNILFALIKSFLGKVGAIIDINKQIPITTDINDLSFFTEMIISYVSHVLMKILNISKIIIFINHWYHPIKYQKLNI